MSGISRVFFGAIAITLTFGVVQLASGRGFAGVSQHPVATPEATANRTTKTDRAAGVTESVAPTRTLSIRLDDLADTSILLRVPIAQQARGTSYAPLMTRSEDRKPACEPVVSVLTEVSRQLQPGRCIT
jgi:hypothetical protein